MFSKKTTKMWSVAFIAFIIFALSTSFITVGAEEIDENQAAVQYLTENGAFNAEEAELFSALLEKAASRAAEYARQKLDTEDLLEKDGGEDS